jgi:hypothetical protein
VEAVPHEPVVSPIVSVVPVRSRILLAQADGAYPEIPTNPPSSLIMSGPVVNCPLTVAEEAVNTDIEEIEFVKFLNVMILFRGVLPGVTTTGKMSEAFMVVVDVNADILVSQCP